jgi:hypothetical protein
MAARPDFVRYYLQFPPVTRTLLTVVVITSISLALGLINRYSLYNTWWGPFLRFFDAGWGIWFLVTLLMCMNPFDASDGSISTEFPS